MPFPGEFRRGAMAGRWFAFAAGLGCLLGGIGSAARGADLEEAQQQFIKGQYSNCVRLCQRALRDTENSEEWRLLLIDSFLTVGQYTNALAVLTPIWIAIPPAFAFA